MKESAIIGLPYQTGNSSTVHSFVGCTHIPAWANRNHRPLSTIEIDRFVALPGNPPPPTSSCFKDFFGPACSFIIRDGLFGGTFVWMGSDFSWSVTAVGLLASTRRAVRGGGSGVKRTFLEVK